MALVALGAAVAKEGFDLLHDRSHRISVLAYLGAAHAGTYLSIDSSPAVPGLVLRCASSGSGPDGEEGAALVTADDEHPPDGLNPSDFCVKQRADWLAYAMSYTRNLPDAEDAVSHMVQKMLEHHVRHGTLCPGARDPVGWSKTVIRNYLIDQFRRSDAQRRHLGRFAPPEADIADDVTDRILARTAMEFVASLEPRAHMIAMLRWTEGLEPQEIAELLEVNARSVRSSLHRTTKKLRIRLGVEEPERILREGAT
jgi:RNA polymerase sigma factor (sigma-70 family)